MSKLRQSLSFQPGLTVTPRFVTVALSVVALMATLWKAGSWMVIHVGQVEAAVPMAMYVEHVKVDSIHHAKTDSAIVVQGQENRALLCYIAKNPSAMVATGVCPDRRELSQAGTSRAP